MVGEIARKGVELDKNLAEKEGQMRPNSISNSNVI